MTNFPFYRESWRSMTTAEITERREIRALNDRLRKVMPRSHDVIVFAGALSQEDQRHHAAVYQAARNFTAFTEDNDPHGEHDCASFEVTFAGKKSLYAFKIDYYDLNLEYGSEFPADPKLTRRVMTLMYADDR